jgi:hypothetical protein
MGISGGDSKLKPWRRTVARRYVHTIVFFYQYLCERIDKTEVLLKYRSTRQLKGSWTPNHIAWFWSDGDFLGGDLYLTQRIVDGSRGARDEGNWMVFSI